MQTNTMTLVGALWPVSSGQAEWTRRIVLVIGGTATLALSAQIKIPLGAVPFTMQTFVVLVMGQSKPGGIYKFKVVSVESAQKMAHELREICTEKSLE